MCKLNYETALRLILDNAPATHIYGKLFMLFPVPLVTTPFGRKMLVSFVALLFFAGYFYGILHVSFARFGYTVYSTFCR
jgi:hypothetical protein